MKILWTTAFLVACGGGHAEPAHSAEGEHHEEHGEKHGDMSPAVHDFHETLAPLWHAPKGPDRVTKTCDSAGTLNAKAEATKDADLVAATKALAAECQKEGRPDFESKFHEVHERFHKVAEKSEH